MTSKVKEDLSKYQKELVESSNFIEDEVKGIYLGLLKIINKTDLPSDLEISEVTFYILIILLKNFKQSTL